MASTETRICGALDPVPDGMRRYRIRGLVGNQRLELLYLLAASQEAAEAAYLERLQLNGAGVRLVVGVTPN